MMKGKQRKEASTSFTKEQLQIFELQEMDLVDFDADGWILDVGGGGEGVVGQLKGAQVVAVDVLESELAEAPDGPLKVVMDARQLKFLDGTFQTATLFCTLMYLKNDEDVQQVLTEMHRVLTPGGRCLVWGLVLPAASAEAAPIVAYPLRIQLPDRVIETTYGTRRPSELRDVRYYAALAETAGFQVNASHVEARWFFMTLHKPLA